MPDKTYKIAKTVDTVIILRYTLKEFAIWELADENTPVAASTEDASTTDIPESVSTEHPPTSSATPEASEHTDVVDAMAAISLEAAGSSTASLFNPRLTLDEDPDPVGEQPLAAPVDGIHYLCSSAHLKQSSECFERALSGRWAEGVPRDDGRYYIFVEDWDEDTLLILLNILHLQHKQVPKGIDLEKLTMIATLVDYYQCHEAIDLYQLLWIHNLLGDNTDYSYNRLVRQYGCASIMWLCVACIFKQSKVLWCITASIIFRGNHDPLRILGLPIPDNIIESILQERNKLLKDMAKGLVETVRQSDFVYCDVRADQDTKSCRVNLVNAVSKTWHTGNWILNLSDLSKACLFGRHSTVFTSLSDIISILVDYMRVRVCIYRATLIIPMVHHYVNATTSRSRRSTMRCLMDGGDRGMFRCKSVLCEKSNHITPPPQQIETLLEHDDISYSHATEGDSTKHVRVDLDLGEEFVT